MLNNPQWLRAIEAVEKASTQWNAATFNPEAFVSLLDKTNNCASIVLCDAIPVLLEWLDNYQTNSSWQSVRLALLQQLTLDDNSSREDIFTACELARGYLEGDSNAQDYRELIENLQMMIESSGTTSAWLDILELFLFYPTADQLAREQLFNLVLNMFYRNPARYSELQWSLLAQFVGECGLICEIPQQILEDSGEKADGGSCRSNIE